MRLFGTNGTCTPPGADYQPINASEGSIPNNYQSPTDTLYFNLTVNASFKFNCSLYINDTFINKSITYGPSEASGTLVNFTNSTNNGYFSYWITCNANETRTNTTLRYYRVDDASPTVATNLTASSVFNLSKSSYINFQFNLSDDIELHEANISLDDIQIYYQADLNQSFLSYNMTYQLVNLSFGVHKINVTVSDGHTKNTIYKEGYSLDNGILLDNVLNIEFKSPYAPGHVTIKEKDGDWFDKWDYQYNPDKVSFSYTPEKPKKKYSFIVESDSPLYISQNYQTPYKEWLVVKDHYVDFLLEDEPLQNININRISSNKVEVVIDNIDKNVLKFKSVGDLNIVHMNYIFYRGNDTSTLNITAFSNISNIPINNFSIYQNGTFLGSTINGSFFITDLTSGEYNFSIDATGYVLKNEIKSIINASNYTLNFSLYDGNSLNVKIYDEASNLLIQPAPVNSLFSYSGGEFTNTTTTGIFNFKNLNVGNYLITFSSAEYSPRTYNVIVSDRSTQSLNVFLANTTTPVGTTTFTVLDKDNSQALQSTAVTMYRFIGASWQPVESKYTDVTGKAQFNYIPLANYKFYMSKTGYNPNIFNLSPILFSTYDVYMTKVLTVNNSADYDGLNIVYYPGSFYNNQSVSFSLVINSPTGSLNNYGIKLSYPGGIYSNTGSNALGEIFTTLVSVNNASISDNVRLDYNYTTSLAGLKHHTVYLPIIFNSTGSSDANTFLSNRNKTYGLGIFERLLICTLIVIFTVGIATMIGQPIPGLALGLFIFGYMAYIGFVPLWAILPSMFIGLIFLIWKSGGY